MKIIFVIGSLIGGGSERVVSILANRFVKQGIKVMIMMIGGNEVAYALDERVKVLRLSGRSGGSLRKRLTRLRRMRRVFKAYPTAVVIPFGAEYCFFAVPAALFLPNRLVIAERNDPAICPHPRLRNILLRRAARLVFQNKAARACYPKHLQKKGVIIANPLNEEVASLSHDASKPRKATSEIVAVSRLEAQKNYPLLLKAFAIFSQTHPAYTLTVYGKGSLGEELQTQAVELGLADKVTFAGFHKDITARIKNSAMYVLSSDYEGLPNALLEAMALGLPVIATDCPIGGCRELLRDGENGLLVPPGDAEALAVAMSRHAEDPAAAAAMGREALKVRELYAADRIVAEWLEVLQ
ncbi:MAG: glycosyltransferase [Lachnospiraceae bacterium]|jgi:glycosyltransferase involved in cell wall biosynthesis|nr:glycosyltransferase [Lachnospiraceae bacterium]